MHNHEHEVPYFPPLCQGSHVQQMAFDGTPLAVALLLPRGRIG